MKNRKISFDDFVKKLEEEGEDYAKDLNSPEDLANIPKFKIMKLIKRLKKG